MSDTVIKTILTKCPCCPPVVTTPCICPPGCPACIRIVAVNFAGIVKIPFPVPVTSIDLTGFNGSFDLLLVPASHPCRYAYSSTVSGMTLAWNYGPISIGIGGLTQNGVTGDLIIDGYRLRVTYLDSQVCLPQSPYGSQRILTGGGGDVTLLPSAASSGFIEPEDPDWNLACDAMCRWGSIPLWGGIPPAVRAFSCS